MKELPNTITTLIAGVAVTLISVWYGQNHGLLPVDASKEAPLIDGLFNAMMSICTGLFLLIQGALVVSLFRFRRRKDDNTDAAPVHGNVPLEIVWTAIPAVTVLWLAVYSFDVYKAVDSGGFAHVHNVANTAQVINAPQTSGIAYAATLSETTPESSNQSPSDQHSSLPQADLDAPDTKIQPPPAQTKPIIPETGELTIDVTGLRYAWIFNYPGSGVTAGELHVPLGRQVKLNLSAQDVIHAFWVPEFRLKQDTIPGQETHLRFTPQTVGEYSVICAELCGAYHGAMKTRVIVQTPEDYRGWLQSQIAGADTGTQTVATSPTEQSPAEFLTPYAEKLGLEPELIATTQPHLSNHHPYLGHE